MASQIAQKESRQWKKEIQLAGKREKDWRHDHGWMRERIISH